MIAGMGRSGGGGELEVEEDGSWKALRSSGVDRAGRFGGTLDGAAVERLKAAVAAAVAAGPPTREAPWPPGGAVDTFWAGEVVGQLTEDDEPPDGWGPLVATCRSLLAGATASPLAALEVDPSGDGRVRHIGTRPVPTDGADFAVEATLFGPDSAVLGSWSSTVAAPSGDDVPPGWQAPLGLGGSGLEPVAGQRVAVEVRFTFVEGIPRPMAAWAST